jgi:DNA-binding NarL/FixJ family response regulator
VKILVIDDHALVREGLRQVLRGLDEHVEVLQAGTCEMGFAQAESHPDLDLILLDYHLPDMTGLAALDVFARDYPELPIVVLSGSANLQIMRQVLASGAAGFVTKSGVSDELLKAVRLVMDGGEYLPPELDIAAAAVTSSMGEARSTLTNKQEQVLQELLDGRSNREIGEALAVSEETIKSHVAAILRHFEVQNRTQAVVAAARSGYVSKGNR